MRNFCGLGNVLGSGDVLRARAWLATGGKLIREDEGAARSLLPIECTLELRLKFDTGPHLGCTMAFACAAALAAEDKLLLPEDIRPWDVDCPGGKPRFAGVGDADACRAIGDAQGAATVVDIGAAIGMTVGAATGLTAGAALWTTPCKRTLSARANGREQEPLSGKSRDEELLACENLRWTGMGAGTAHPRGTLNLTLPGVDAGICAKSLGALDPAAKRCVAF